MRFVWVFNHVSRVITWSLFNLRAPNLVKWPISTWPFIWWCQFIEMTNRWFWTFFERCFDRPEYWMSTICIAKLKYCILSEVCMIKTVPHSTVSPQMWYINGMKGWFTSTQICWQDFVKLSCLTQSSAWFFPGLINLRWWKATMDLKCDRRLLLFLGVHMTLSTRGKIWFTLGLFANYFYLKPVSLSLKSHMNVL